MRWFCYLFCAVGLCAAPARADKPKGPEPIAPVLDPDKEGRALAERLLTAAPTGETEFNGVLKVQRSGFATERIPITSRLIGGTTNWQVVYETQRTKHREAERVAVIHAPDAPNVYLYRRGTNAPVRLTGEQAAMALAGSDFWLCDLGLEFFHWPVQRLVRREMTKSRVCNVLESSRAATDRSPGYATVRSWIDVESGGVVKAEAFGPDKVRIKEFEVDRLAKVGDQWHVERMEMKPSKTGGRTFIEFDLKEKE